MVRPQEAWTWTWVRPQEVCIPAIKEKVADAVEVMANGNANRTFVRIWVVVTGIVDVRVILPCDHEYGRVWLQ